MQSAQVYVITLGDGDTIWVMYLELQTEVCISSWVRSEKDVVQNNRFLQVELDPALCCCVRDD